VPEPIRLSLYRKQQRDDPAVLNATVLELADAGHFHIEPADSQHPVMVSPNILPHASKLPPYQASVVARLLHRRGVTQKPVPLTALQPGEDDRADTWHKDFTKQVRQAATERGLLQPPLNAMQFLTTLLFGLFTALFVSDYHGTVSRLVVLVPASALVLFTFAWAAQIRPTAAGRRLLAESDPLEQPSPAPVPTPAPAPQPTAPISVLPNQLQPLPEHQVWSDYGGTWHPLDIESKETYAVSSGVPAVFILILFAAISIGGLLFAKRDGAPSGVLPFAVFGALPLALLAFAGASLLRRRHLPKRAVIRGYVAKMWTVTHRGGESDTTYYYCALDVGRAPASVKLKTNRGLYGRLQVGMEIEVLVNPRARRIKDVHFAPQPTVAEME
jgi:hypothetical protein